jgi:hypothetical protein
LTGAIAILDIAVADPVLIAAPVASSGLPTITADTVRRPTVQAGPVHLGTDLAGSRVEPLHFSASAARRSTILPCRAAI